MQKKQTISIDRPRHRLAVGIAAAVLVVAAGAWWAMRPAAEGARTPEQPSSSGTSANPFGKVQPGMRTEPEAAPAWLSAGSDAASKPTLFPELSNEEWAALREATQGQPNGQGELQRLVEYARFQKGFERWQNLREQPKTEEQRRELARELLAAVPEHLKRQEMMAGEALLVQTALLEDAEPDPVRRQALQQQARTQIEGMVRDQGDMGAADDATRARQVQELQRRQAEIIRKCQSQPGGVCDQRALEAEMQAARVSVFGG